MRWSENVREGEGEREREKEEDSVEKLPLRERNEI